MLGMNKREIRGNVIFKIFFLLIVMENWIEGSWLVLYLLILTYLRVLGRLYRDKV